MDNNLINIAMVIEYDGSMFCGFQKQIAGVRTIQYEIELALFNFTHELIEISSSGRTDTGVHALYQIINFKTTINRPLQNWKRGVNALLPKDIVIKEAIIADNDFYARFASSRSYHYYLAVDPMRLTVWRGKVGWYHRNLDLELMLEAQSLLLGIQDFSSFRAAGCQAKNPVRNMTNVGISKRNNLIRFEFTANAFLYHMVRNMVGALVFVGKGSLTIPEFTELVSSCSRKLAPPTFMADGLYLVDVHYQDTLYPDAKFSYKPYGFIF